MIEQQQSRGKPVYKLTLPIETKLTEQAKLRFKTKDTLVTLVYLSASARE